MAMELNDGCDFMFPESFEEELTGCSGEAAAANAQFDCERAAAFGPLRA